MDNYIILGHENPDVDSIISGYILEKIMIKKGYNASFIIPDKKIEDDSLNICLENGFDPRKFQKEITTKNNKYILVDHHERDVDGEIVGIIDHHPTNKKFNINNYYNEKVSSTVCFIAKNAIDYLEKEDLFLVVLATFVDTVSFHSSKGRKEDYEWCLEICKKYDFNYDKLYLEGLRLTNIDDLNKASLNGLKKYVVNNIKIESSYIQIRDFLLNKDVIENIIDILKKYREENNIDIFVFIVHDMKYFKTMYYYIEKDNLKEKYYDSYISRGNVIIPEIVKRLSS